MYQIDIAQTKTQLDSLLQSALSGEEVIITQNSEPVLKLIRVVDSKKRRHAGSAKGLISMSPNFDEPLEDFLEYME